MGDPDALDATIASSIQAAIDGANPDPHAGMLRYEESVDLMPANIDLAGLEMGMFIAMLCERLLGTWVEPLGRVRLHLHRLPGHARDNPLNAFAAADGALITVSAEFLPVSAMTELLKSVGRVRRQINPSLAVEGILVALYDGRNNLAKEIERTVRKQFDGTFRVFDAAIPAPSPPRSPPRPARASSSTTGTARRPRPSRASLRRRWQMPRKKTSIELPAVDGLFTS